MKTGKPKGKEPCLIGSTLGTPRCATVERKRTCRRCKSTLEKGTTCYEIPRLGGSFPNYQSYCSECFKRILAKTREKLGELEELVG